MPEALVSQFYATWYDEHLAVVSQTSLSFLRFLSFGFRLKAARTRVCSHDQEHGAICPRVSFHEAPIQTVQ